MSWGKTRLAGITRLVLGAALLSALLVHALRVPEQLRTSDVDLHEVDYVGADSCRRCHQDHYESWHRTFHRTMTQDVGANSPIADFSDPSSLTYGGVAAHFGQDDGGAPQIAFEGWDYEGRTVFEVTRTVGSRRYQQFLAPTSEGQLLRLPVAWDVEAERFFHLNGAFLTPDPPAPEVGHTVSTADYGRHAASWNDNCLFCHNVGVSPGRQRDGSFETEFAELGISCEACHGPGRAHTDANSDPLRRYWLHHTDTADPTIINPERLSASRRNDVCGRCHGQRLTDDIDTVLAHGDPFIPGDLLDASSEPLWRDTPLNGEEHVFALRFWPDGAPRLTAYEYQGTLQSRCSLDEEFSCTTCHGMHEGDPRGQLRPEAESDTVCVSCHSEVDSAHSGHAEGEPGSACVDCHMPRTVYGIVAGHRNHRIDSPVATSPSLDDRPDACTTCHIEESLPWVQAQIEELWPDDGHVAEPITTNTDPAAAIHRQRLFGGDPIVRALAAQYTGSSVVFLGPSSRARRVGDLMNVMLEDSYPAVRRIASRSLTHLFADASERTQAILRDYNPEGTVEARAETIQALQTLLGEHAWIAPDRAWVAQLRRRAANVNIEIGE